MSDTEYHLDSMVCFAIYSASHAVAKAHRSALEPWELTYPQYIALLELGSAGGLTVGELGARMNLDSGTLSPLLRRLEHRGLVLRHRGSADERVVTATLSEAGTQVLRELVHSLDGLRDAYGFDSPAQAQALIGELQRISDGMRRFAEHPVAPSLSTTPLSKGTP